MKQYVPTNVVTNTSSTQSVTPSPRGYSNSEMQELLRNGGVPMSSVVSNTDMNQLLTDADLVTDVGGLMGDMRIKGVNAGINGVKGYSESPCTTSTGKMIDGGLDAAMSLVIGSSFISSLSDIILPEGYKIGELTDSTSSAVTSTVESVLTGDLSAMENYQRKVQEGQYGEVIQSTPDAQNYWEERGFTEGMLDFGEEVLELLK